MRRLGFVTVCLTAGVLGIAHAGTWSAIGGDNTRSGVAAPIEKLPLVLDWRYSTGWQEQNPSSPAVLDDRVYFCAAKKVYCLSTATGELVWQFDVREYVDSSPAVANGIVYLGADDGRVIALDAATGGLKWQRKLEGAVKSTPTVTDQYVIVGCEDEKVYCLRAADGEVHWPNKVVGPVRSSAACDGRYAYITSSERIYAFNLADGRQAWSDDLRDRDVTASPVVVGQKVLVCAGGAVRCYASDKNRIIWQYPAHGRISGSPAANAEVAVVGDQAGFVHAISMGSGERRWSTELLKPVEGLEGEEPQPVPIKSAAVIAGEYCLVRSENGVISALGLADGRIRWQYKVEPEPATPESGGALGTAPGAGGAAQPGGIGMAGGGMVGPVGGGLNAGPSSVLRRSHSRRSVYGYGGMGWVGGNIGGPGNVPGGAGNTPGGRMGSGQAEEEIIRDFLTETNSSLAVADGCVYVLSGESALYALRPSGVDLAPPKVEAAWVLVPTVEGGQFEEHEFEAVNDLGGASTDQGYSEAIPAAAPVYVELTVEDEGSGIDPAGFAVSVPTVPQVSHEYYPDEGLLVVTLGRTGGAAAIPEGTHVVDVQMRDFTGRSQHARVTIKVDPSKPQPTGTARTGMGPGGGMMGPMGSGGMMGPMGGGGMMGPMGPMGGQ